jgi:LPXTG-motif cell wall-anchored protein
MKKSVLVFSMISLFVIGSLNMANAQEQPAPKKDTVNMDTEAKPTFYYATEDEVTGDDKGSMATIAIIAGAVIVVAGAGFFLLKKKK